MARVHSVAFAPRAFNPNPADPHWGGGRFDATPEDPYPFLYAASDGPSAICETLLRDLPTQPSGGRKLQEVAVRDRAITWLETKADLQLVSLRNARELGAIGQDTWLVQSDSSEYPFTRRWAHAIRAWAQWSQGLVWPCRHEPAGTAYVFFGDRIKTAAGSVFSPASPDPPLEETQTSLLDGDGRLYLEAVLTDYNVGLS